MEDKSSCLAICEKFGRQAQYFESYVVPLWQEVYDSLVKRARVKPGSAALDVGTGSGEVALRLARATGTKGKVVGIDVQPEMLQIARAKAAQRKARNLQFRKMSAEEMSFGDDTFDSALGNYALCCFREYGTALEGILRTLKPGGRLTYNHGGPSDSEALVRLTEVFGKYKTKKPSEGLRDLRASDESLRKAVERYRDPSTTLSLMRSIGYVEPRAEVVRRVIKYKDPRALVDRFVAFDWSREVEEIPPVEVRRFSAEAAEVLAPLSRGKGFRYEDDMVFFTGLKE